MKLLSYWPWFLLFGIVLVLLLLLAAIPPYRQQADIEQVFNKGGPTQCCGLGALG